MAKALGLDFSLSLSSASVGRWRIRFYSAAGGGRGSRHLSFQEFFAAETLNFAQIITHRRRFLFAQLEFWLRITTWKG
jgi:hypothetical protein